MQAWDYSAGHQWYNEKAGKCMSTAGGGGTSNGTKVIIYNCLGSDEQHWDYVGQEARSQVCARGADVAELGCGRQAAADNWWHGSRIPSRTGTQWAHRPNGSPGTRQGQAGG